MSGNDPETRRPSIESFVDGPSPPLEDWRWVWEQDEPFPVRSHRGVVGRLIVFLKRLLRPLVRQPQIDLWERQRAFNLALLEDRARQAQGYEARFASIEESFDRLARDLQQVQGELVQDLERSAAAQEALLLQVQEALRADLNASVDAGRQTQEALQESLRGDLQRVETTQSGEVERVQASLWEDLNRLMGYLESQDERVLGLETLKDQGFEEVREHNDALFALVDQKLDRYREESRRLHGGLGSLLAAAKSGGDTGLSRAVDEQDYVSLEHAFRGTEDEIEERVSIYARKLRGRGQVLDLGCGRGEALEVLARHGIDARGIDSSAEMVAICRQKGLAVEEGDIFTGLEATAAGSLGGIVSFHVIEHLAPASLDRLVHLAWQALAPGGLLVLETPSPLSLVVSARNFWLDPTHRRPVHPASLELSFKQAGFVAVERLDLHPFAEEERLPALTVADLPEELRPAAVRINEIRDRLDELLFGYQDFAMIGERPA